MSSYKDRFYEAKNELLKQVKFIDSSIQVKKREIRQELMREIKDLNEQLTAKSSLFDDQDSASLIKSLNMKIVELKKENVKSTDALKKQTQEFIDSIVADIDKALKLAE